MIPLSDSTKRRVGLAMFALIELCAVASVILTIAADEPAAAVEGAFFGVTFGAVIFLCIRAQPHNGAVWVLIWAAFFGVLSDLGKRIAIHRGDVTGAEILAGDVSRSPSDLDLLASLGLTAELVLWLPGIYLIAIHALLLFPGGQATSSVWRVVAVVTAGIMVLLTIVGIVRSGPWQTASYDEIVDDSRGVFGWLSLLQALLILAALASLVQLVRRYRRSAGVERLQFRWVVWALGLFVSNFFLYWLWEAVGVDRVASNIALANVIVAFGIAVLKYRLYEIDVVISKSVMYLGLIAAITAVYAAIVVGPLLVLGVSDNEEGPGLLLPIVATGAVALLFEPIRSRMERWANRLVFGKRSTPHEVLSKVTSRLADTEGRSTDDLARLVAEGTGADCAALWSFDGETVQVAGSWSTDGATPTALPETDEFSAVVDVVHDSERLGAISVTKPRNDPITPADRELLDDVAAGAGLGLRNERLNRELEDRAVDVRESRRRLIEAQDRERHRLERDLHDGAQQQVVALKVKLGIAKTVAQRESADDIADRLVGLADETQEAVDALRAVAHGIYPPLLESEGLEPALRAVERTSSFPIELEAVDLERYDRSTEATVYFCVTETLERARMSGATGAHVGLAGTNGALVLSVDLRGRAGDVDLTAVSDRLSAAGGTIAVDERPDDRTSVTSSLPVLVSAGSSDRHV